MEASARSPTKILIVDDEEGHRRSLSIALRMDGFDVACARSAADALDVLSRQSCDVALVDLMMPDVNGLDLARQLRTLFPQVKVVLISAYHLTEQQLRRSASGVVGFVPKPYAMPDLVAFLRSKTER